MNYSYQKRPIQENQFLGHVLVVVAFAVAILLGWKVFTMFFIGLIIGAMFNE